MGEGIPVYLKRTGCLVGYVHGRVPELPAGETVYHIDRTYIAGQLRKPPIVIAGLAIRHRWRGTTRYTIEVELEDGRPAKLWVYVATALYGAPGYDFRLL